jgi:uncharacterized protein YhaN
MIVLLLKVNNVFFFAIPYLTPFVGDELSESFCLIPSGSDPTPSSLKKENANLKAQIETIQKQLAATERVLKLRKEQDQQLKESIVLARREVRYHFQLCRSIELTRCLQAQRAMGASAVNQRPGQGPIDFSSLNLNIPPIPPPIAALNSGRNREAQYLTRVRELEEEVRAVKEELRLAKVDNEKQVRSIVLSSFTSSLIGTETESGNNEVQRALGEAQRVC